jgi:hypothetical protein
MDRVSISGNYQDDNDPALFGFRFLPDPNKTTSSIKIEKVGSTGRLAFFGATAVLTPQEADYSLPENSEVTGLQGEYFNGTNFERAAMVRLDSTVNFDWGTKSPDSTKVDADQFSVRWTGQILAPVTGQYTFATISNNGVRLWVNGQQIINNWSWHDTAKDIAIPISLEAGKSYSIKLEYYEYEVYAQIQLLWSYPGQAEQVVPNQQLSPISASNAVFVTVPEGETEAIIAIIPVADTKVEGEETVIATLLPSTGYTLKSTATLANLSLIDNNVAGVQIANATLVTDPLTQVERLVFTESFTNLVTEEVGNSSTIGVRLSAEPTANVTVTFSGLDSSEGQLSVTTLTFTPTNWNQYQSLTVRGLDDTLLDGNITYTLKGTTSSSDPLYQNKAIYFDVTNLDDEKDVNKTSEQVKKELKDKDINQADEGALPRATLKLLNTPTEANTSPTQVVEINLSQPAGPNGAVVLFDMNGSQATPGQDFTLNHRVFLSQNEDNKQNNPFTGIDVGTNSTPAFADLDQDGDLDAFIGTAEGTVRYYENVGSPINPKFQEKTGTANPFNGIDVGDNAAPVIADIDGNTVPEAFIGGNDGKVRYYRLDSNNNTFVLQQPELNNPLNKVTGAESKLSFGDLDNDGDLDVAVGGADGKVRYFQNTGNRLKPTFTEQTGTANPFTSITSPNSAPTFGDLDGDGKLELVVGSSNGTFTNTTLFNNFDVGENSTPFLVDLDGDGDLDAVVGNGDGTLSYYEQFQGVTIPAGQSRATLNITPRNDAIAEGNETLTVNLRNGYGYTFDPNQASLNITLQDDTDKAGVTITPLTSDNKTREAGTSLGYKVKLNSQPIAPVTVYFATNDFSAGGLTTNLTNALSDTLALEFNPENWNLEQTFYVKGQDDKIDNDDIAYSK